MATQNINAFYREHAMEYAAVSECGMIVTLPSEKKEGVCYQVQCKQTAKGVEATSCQCRGFGRWAHCKHQTIVQEWQDARYVAPKITEIEAGSWYILESNTQVWKDAESGEWLAAGPTENAIEIVESYLAVQTAEQIVATPVVEQPAPEIVELSESVEQTIAPVSIAASDSRKLASVLAEQKVDLGLVGNLTSNRGFQMWK